MKKLKLDDLRVASFPTSTAADAAKGTVRANDASTTDTCWDCSIDICSHDCGLTTVGMTTHNTH